MSPFYTRSGDDGSTGLLGEGRLPKYHPRMEAIGALDEASAALGLARSLSLSVQTKSILLEIQSDLYRLMAEAAATPENAPRFRSLDITRLQWLESQTDAIAARVPIPAEFILPGDTTPGAALSLARTVVRRAERRVAELVDRGEVTGTVILPYLNRLSSLCFVLELEANHEAGKETSLAGKTRSDGKS
jgi:cob(I)alamin adenosyltransferase